MGPVRQRPRRRRTPCRQKLGRTNSSRAEPAPGRGPFAGVRAACDAPVTSHSGFGGARAGSGREGLHPGGASGMARQDHGREGHGDVEAHVHC